MRWPWSPCNHPSGALAGLKPEPVTVERRPEDADFETVVVHLWCRLCSKPVQVRYIRMIGGVEEFLDKGN